MTVEISISVGFVVSVLARAMASSIAVRSSPSLTLNTCQPAAAKRAAVSSEEEMDVVPASEMRLES